MQNTIIIKKTQKNNENKKGIWKRYRYRYEKVDFQIKLNQIKSNQIKRLSRKEQNVGGGVVELNSFKNQPKMKKGWIKS